MGNKKAIINGIIHTGDALLYNKVIVTENKRIIAIQDDIPINVDAIDLKGKHISSGLIDIQINGGYHYYFSKEINEASLEDITNACHDFGTLYFLPTLISSTKENILKAIDAVRSFQEKFLQSGALGMHLEGPFFNPEKRGAHNKDLVRRPTDKELEEIVKYGKGVIKLMTIAPEVFNEEQIRFLQENNIRLSAGHSNMSYEQAQYYFSKGIHLATHLYNAMSAFTHRAPGFVGATLAHDDVYTSIILDGHHCHYAAAQLAYRLKKEKLFLITDSTFLGRKQEHFEWDSFDATLKDNMYRNKEGNLAGAAISMVEAVKNAKQYLNISLEEAVKMATSIVAKAIEEDNSIGFIKESYPARFFVFDDELNNYSTIIL